MKHIGNQLMLISKDVKDVQNNLAQQVLDDYP